MALPAGALSPAFAFAAIMLLAAPTVMAQEPAASPASELTTKETVQQTAEAVAEKVAVKIVEKAVKAENTSKRPAAWSGPTRVTFMVFVVDIDDINDAEQNFAANVSPAQRSVHASARKQFQSIANLDGAKE